ncbi:hypothetical protein TNCV_133381 [Trichonephila clavipes]|nr:hypothetical protein TNCV_133381 [Trichonephila clavipes]
MSVLEALEKLPRSLPSSGMYNTRHYESTLQEGFRYRVLLATKSRRNHRQRAYDILFTSVWRSLAKVGPCAIKINNHHHHHRQRASGQRGKVGDDASAASGSAIGYEARHHASYF